MKKIILTMIAAFGVMCAMTSCKCATNRNAEVEFAIDSAALFPAVDTVVTDSTMIGPELTMPAQAEDAADIPQE